MTKPEPITAGTISALLSVKHGKDLYVGECKTGGTWHGAPIRMDGWAMTRSWAHMTFTGYEIKVARSDFLKDDKWPAYLQFVHHFYFVCPWGLIQPEETPEGTGLMWVTQHGRKIITKRKAPRRQMKVADALPVMLYILMSRATIREAGHMINRIEDREESREKSLAYWRHWLAQKEESRELGQAVSAAIRAKVAAAENEVDRARKLMKRVDEVDRILKDKLGLSLGRLERWNMEQELLDAVTFIPESLMRKMRGTADHLRSAADEMDTWRQNILTNHTDS